MNPIAPPAMPPSANPLLRIHPRWTALACWLVVAGLLLWNYRDAIAVLQVADSDDALRLVQVRDLIAGQSWFDTTQYRIDPPRGGMMHWSRLVDLPIALGIRFLTLFVEQPVAERFVLALYPMAILGLMFLCAKLWLARFDSRPLTHVGLIVLATTGTMLFQFAPLRIDHHSWQIVLAVVVMIFALRPPTIANGAWAGLAMANYVGISIEGAAYMVLFGAIFAIDWLLDRDRGARFVAYVAALAGGSAAILALTRGPWTLGDSYCDAMSRPYLAALFALALIALVGRRVIGEATPARRIAVLALAGGGGLAAFGWADATCLAGPFEALDPQVRLMWYQNVKEGLPAWHQTTLRQVHLAITVLVGMAGMVAAWRTTDGDAARRWRTSLLGLIGAAAVAALVFRTISIAHIYAIPGIAWLIVVLGAKARGLPRAVPRIIATLAVFAFVPFFHISAATWLLTASPQPAPRVARTGSADETLKRVVSCLGGRSLDQLRAVPPSLLFAPLDASPFLLAYTPHSVVATGHHRNQAAMRRVIDGFLLVPDQARRVIEASGARYFVACHKAPELYNYRKRNSAGLAAALYAGKVPDWLVAIPPPAGSEIRIYRIRRPAARAERPQAGRKSIATPFMQ